MIYSDKSTVLSSDKSLKSNVFGHLSHAFAGEAALFSRISQDHLILTILLLIALVSAADLIADLSEGVSSAHLLQEAFVMLIATLAFCRIASSLYQSKKSIAALQAELEAIKQTPQPESEAVLAIRRKLSELIAAQFVEWKLSKSEQQVGWLLLKGFSLKEIAMIRGTMEKTIRQQASAIYKKAGVRGRHSFSAWFIEDYL